MNKKQREILVKMHEYSENIGRHKPSISTKFYKYREALLIFSKILLANFQAFNKDNPYQDEDLYTIKEGFEDLDKIISEL